MTPTVAYLHLSYEDYKELERQMRAFAETKHHTGPGESFYHKSIRLKINAGMIMEFHGPLVRGAGADDADRRFGQPHYGHDDDDVKDTSGQR